MLFVSVRVLAHSSDAFLGPHKAVPELPVAENIDRDVFLAMGYKVSFRFFGKDLVREFEGKANAKLQAPQPRDVALPYDRQMSVPSPDPWQGSLSQHDPMLEGKGRKVEPLIRALGLIRTSDPEGSSASNSAA